MMRHTRPGLLVFSLVCATILSILPLPPFFGNMQTTWLLVVLSYWVFSDPQNLGWGWIWLLGIFNDVLLVQPMGLHAAVFVSMAYGAQCLAHRAPRMTVQEKMGISWFFGMGFLFLMALCDYLDHGILSGYFYGNALLGLSAQSVLVVLCLHVWVRGR